MAYRCSPYRRNQQVQLLCKLLPKRPPSCGGHALDVDQTTLRPLPTNLSSSAMLALARLKGRRSMPAPIEKQSACFFVRFLLDWNAWCIGPVCLGPADSRCPTELVWNLEVEPGDQASQELSQATQQQVGKSLEVIQN